MSLRVKKYFIVTWLGSAATVAFGFSSNGSRIEIPIASSGPAPSAAACSRHDHPAETGERCRHLLGLRVQRIVLLGARRAEHRHLRGAVIRCEEPERVAHLLDGRGRDLEVEPFRAVVAEFETGRHDAPHQAAVHEDALGVHQFVDADAQLVGVAHHPTLAPFLQGGLSGSGRTTIQDIRHVVPDMPSARSMS
jgi:hypothetical protein